LRKFAVDLRKPHDFTNPSGDNNKNNNKKKMEKVVSGIRPTGNLHLGNYFGAVKSFVKMQDEYDCLFFIADWHSLTTHPKPDDIQNSARVILAEYLACGLDPEKAPIYVQSDVKETLELYLFLNMNAYLGELERVTTFKEKARKQPDNVNAGLLTYPTLMAADILQHRAQKVPVGKDQEQNMEMARKCARRFNNIYGVDFFPEPQNFYFAEKALKVPGLDGSGKMGKSEGNCIYLADDDKTIKKKVMKAVTDMGPKTPNSERPEVIENLFTFLRLCSTPDTFYYFDEKWNDCTLRYGDLKKQIAEDLCKTIAPIRERINEYKANQELLDRIAREGAERARQSASDTLKEVRRIIGFRVG
jgi:tryptophanyl-tRNA synthetase